MLGEASHHGPGVNPSGRLVTSSRVAMAKLVQLNLRCCQPSSWSMTIYTLDTYRWVGSELCVCPSDMSWTYTWMKIPCRTHLWMAQITFAESKRAWHGLRHFRPLYGSLTDKCRCPTLRSVYLESAGTVPWFVVIGYFLRWHRVLGWFDYGNI